jgi:hypothetical protein
MNLPENLDQAHIARFGGELFRLPLRITLERSSESTPSQFLTVFAA